jgi:hypothetical protein
MQFQINEDEYYLNISTRLGHIVPDFRSSFDKDDGVYLILGDFGDFLILNIDKSEIFLKCIDFINEAIEKGKSKTEDAIVSEIFYPIYENNYVLNKIKPELSQKALIIFNKFQPVK